MSATTYCGVVDASINQAACQINHVFGLTLHNQYYIRKTQIIVSGTSAVAWQCYRHDDVTLWNVEFSTISDIKTKAKYFVFKFWHHVIRIKVCFTWYGPFRHAPAVSGWRGTYHVTTPFTCYEILPWCFVQLYWIFISYKLKSYIYRLYSGPVGTCNVTNMCHKCPMARISAWTEATPWMQCLQIN